MHYNAAVVVGVAAGVVVVALHGEPTTTVPHSTSTNLRASRYGHFVVCVFTATAMRTTTERQEEGGLGDGDGDGENENEKRRREREARNAGSEEPLRLARTGLVDGGLVL